MWALAVLLDPVSSDSVLRADLMIQRTMPAELQQQRQQQTRLLKQLQTTLLKEQLVQTAALMMLK